MCQVLDLLGAITAEGLATDGVTGAYRHSNGCLPQLTSAIRLIASQVHCHGESREITEQTLLSSCVVELFDLFFFLTTSSGNPFLKLCRAVIRLRGWAPLLSLTHTHTHTHTHTKTHTLTHREIHTKTHTRGWGFSSVVERLPRNRKALGSVPSSEKKNQKKKTSQIILPRMRRAVSVL